MIDNQAAPILDIYTPNDPNEPVENPLMDTEKKVYCPECEYATDHTSNMKRHIRTIHNSTLDYIRSGYPCPVCDQVFTKRLNMQRHLRSLHGFDDPSIQRHFPCDMCPQRFTTKSNLKRHLRTLHGKIDSNNSTTTDNEENESSDFFLMDTNSSDVEDVDDGDITVTSFDRDQLRE